MNYYTCWLAAVTGDILLVNISITASNSMLIGFIGCHKVLSPVTLQLFSCCDFYVKCDDRARY